MLVDAHAHLDMYGAGARSAIARIRALDVHATAVSMDIESYRRIKALVGEDQLFTPAFGVHPWKAPEFAQSLDELVPYIEEAEVLGEIGLDYRFAGDASAYPSNPGAWSWLTGSLGEPDLIVKVVDRLAQVRSEDRDQLAAQVAVNYEAVMQRPPVKD